MCYMKDSQVGVRELRQNLSVYLRRVAVGEALEVTERGRPVAMLMPLRKPATIIERLVASGRASPRAGDLGELGPPTGVGPSGLGAALARDRGRPS